MKETKMYVDGEFPQVYFEPIILEDIKTHDRELVAKVLEKVKKELDGDYNQYRINYILDQIQKEVEDE